MLGFVRSRRYPEAVLGSLVATACAAASLGCSSAETQALSIRPFASGFDAPIHVAAPAGESGRLYVVEQRGVVWRLQGGNRRVFIDIRSQVRAGGEQGLLSIAFHPQYAKNRRFYLNYTDTSGDTRIVEYRANPSRTQGLLNTRRELLAIDQPYSNHNGGLSAFGPDGRLWIGMGDGGSGGDPEDRAQNMGSRLGKLLTVDVLRPSRVRIAALGLRNPWRFSFDRANGDLYIGDVGQGAIEEIDYLPRARLASLQNYGWDLFEGRSRFEETPQGPGRLVMPVAQYSHSQGCSVTGGFVYRGKAVPAAKGRYFYGDYCSGKVWSLVIRAGGARAIRNEPFDVGNLTSFGEDADGELYLVSHGGTIYRLAG
jgi:glucose/arabinose dehydrogenase